MSEGDVILLDGDCGLCTRLAVFMHPRMKSSASLRFLAIESEEGQAIISTFPQRVQDADTVYLFRDGTPYIRSSAAIRFLFYMRWYYAMWYPFAWIVPLPIRNLAYRFVARYRHRIFRKPASCVFPMPSTEG
ncbi:MAG TPA: DCC1-like thiol-disulfide oxidoreductase family protein [Poseidonia sp.]|nr:DCC1-like thiol-disulfide oxidoreductase family protein [Poseidonia sp.]